MWRESRMVNWARWIRRIRLCTSSSATCSPRSCKCSRINTSIWAETRCHSIVGRAIPRSIRTWSRATCPVTIFSRANISAGFFVSRTRLRPTRSFGRRWTVFFLFFNHVSIRLTNKSNGITNPCFIVTSIDKYFHPERGGTCYSIISNDSIFHACD